MFELLARGKTEQDRWRKPLVPGQQYVLGRSPGSDLVVSWDPLISRAHVRLSMQLDHLLVSRSSDSKNPLIFCGRETETCRVEVGGHFVLGNTVFRLSRPEAADPLQETPLEELAFQPQTLRQVRYQDAENRIEVLTHLPEVIEGARNDSELYYRLVSLMLRGVVHAEAVAIVMLDATDGVKMLSWDRRRETAGQFQPSRRLVRDSLAVRRQSVLHVWGKDRESPTDHTLGAEFDWAYCTPVPGLATEPTGLYVAGRMGKTYVPGTTLSDGLQLEGDVKFTELVADIISAVVKSKRLERQKAGLRQFFAPPILAALGDDLNTSLLEPCECDVTVMFCDLRGFSQRAELAGENLIGLLDRVSRALGVMTHQILAHGGVTGDFQGDATLGFWGWPFPSPEAAVNACKAALAIREEFARTAHQRNHPLADFAMGLGMAHGRAVAGKIGTSDQVKVTVFGPVVNLASRLEGLTKQLRVPIVLDETTAALVRPRLSPAEGRLRKLARLLPYGLETPVTVHELMPPAANDPLLQDDHIVQYERGVDHFIGGRWDEAYHCLHAMPPGDRAQDFLIQLIAQAGRTAPPNWDGIIRLPNK